VLLNRINCIGGCVEIRRTSRTSINVDASGYGSLVRLGLSLLRSPCVRNSRQKSTIYSQTNRSVTILLHVYRPTIILLTVDRSLFISGLMCYQTYLTPIKTRTSWYTHGTCRSQAFSDYHLHVSPAATPSGVQRHQQREGFQ